MRKILVSSTVFTLLSICFLGCDNKGDEQTVQESIELIKINKIEENITQKISEVGCKKDKNKTGECREDKPSAAKFILETLSKERERFSSISPTQQPKEKTPSLREKLKLSLEQIEKEESQKRDIKDGLIALVSRAGSSQHIKREELKSFIQNIQNQENKKIVNRDKLQNFIDTIQNKEAETRAISLVKKELNSFVEEATSSQIKTEEVKERLENLIENVTTSTTNLEATEETLKKLVANAEETNSPSATKFATAIMKDVSTQRISILDDNHSYLTIRVENGDTLSVLAQRYYNDAGKYKLIYDANKDKIGKDYLIYPSTTLVIPKL
jgi:LysM repeat protein